MNKNVQIDMAVDNLPQNLPGARFMVLWSTPSDVDAFETHYRTVHVPLVRQLPRLRRYVFSRNVRGVRGEPFYMVATLEWDDEAALQQAFTSPQGRAVGQDVAKLARFAELRSMTFELEDQLDDH